jgi:hypothetical protein
MAKATLRHASGVKHKELQEKILLQRGVVSAPGGFAISAIGEVAQLDFAVQRRIRGLLPGYHVTHSAVKDGDDKSADGPVGRVVAHQPFLEIRDSHGHVLEHAPLAVRPPPSVLPTRGRMTWISGAGSVPLTQARVRPPCCTITIECALALMDCVRTTTTWRALADVKGATGVTMRDVATHFLRPWTQGTGCSIALLLLALDGGDVYDPPPLKPADAFVSFAWDGAVSDFLESLHQMARVVPLSTRIWVSCFSLYLPEDAVVGSLMHAEQIDAASTVIESRPRLGLFVVHSSAVNVYSRLWVLYELWFAQQLKVKCQGLIDATRWPAELFSLEAAAIDKALETLAGVSRWQDRVFLLRNRLANVELSAVAQSARTFFEQTLEDLRASHAPMDLGRTGIEMMAAG